MKRYITLRPGIYSDPRDRGDIRRLDYRAPLRPTDPSTNAQLLIVSTCHPGIKLNKYGTHPCRRRYPQFPFRLHWNIYRITESILGCVCSFGGGECEMSLKKEEKITTNNRILIALVISVVEWYNWRVNGCCLQQSRDCMEMARSEEVPIEIKNAHTFR